MYEDEKLSLSVKEYKPPVVDTKNLLLNFTISVLLSKEVIFFLKSI